MASTPCSPPTFKGIIGLLPTQHSSLISLKLVITAGRPFPCKDWTLRNIFLLLVGGALLPGASKFDRINHNDTYQERHIRMWQIPHQTVMSVVFVDSSPVLRTVLLFLIQKHALGTSILDCP